MQVYILKSPDYKHLFYFEKDDSYWKVKKKTSQKKRRFILKDEDYKFIFMYREIIYVLKSDIMM